MKTHLLGRPGLWVEEQGHRVSVKSQLPRLFGADKDRVTEKGPNCD